jgi:putative nucleotidyltransferase with HDIG domain
VASLGHLVRRFRSSLQARRPGAADQEWVAGILSRPASTVFFSQPSADQAHGIRAGRHVAEASPNRADLITAALLHDVGKRVSRLGTVGRSLATAFGFLRLPMPARMRRYLDHGVIGAAELSSLRMPEIVVAFAEHHHGPRPEGIAPDDWDLLLGADDE